MPERALDGDRVCVARRAEDIFVVVAGGPGPCHIAYSANFADTQAVTKQVRRSAPSA